MAITRTALGTAQGDTAGTIPLTGGITAGDVLIAVTAGDEGVICTIWWDPGQQLSPELDAEAINSGNVVTQVRRFTVATSKEWDGTYPYVYCGGEYAWAVAIMRLDGLITSPMDKSSAGTGSSSTPSSGATTETSQAAEILIGACGWEWDMGDTYGTWDNGFTDGQIDGRPDKQGAKGVVINEGYKIVSATGEYTASKTGAHDCDWAAVIVTYKGVAAPPAERFSGINLGILRGMSRGMPTQRP